MTMGDVVMTLGHRGGHDLDKNESPIAIDRAW
jgi:hypothetical protein